MCIPDIKITFPALVEVIMLEPFKELEDEEPHDVEGMEEVHNFPQDILRALNRESEGSKSNIEET